MSEDTEGNPQKNPSQKDHQQTEITTSFTHEILETKGAEESQRKTNASKYLSDYLCGWTAQDFWNFLLVCFTGILAWVAVSQYRFDAAYLSTGPITFELGPGFVTLPIENDGRRVSSKVKTKKYDAYFDKNGNILGKAEKELDEIPAIPAGRTPSMLTYELPNWDGDHIRDVKEKMIFVRIGAILTYDAPIWEQETNSFCYEITTVKKVRDLTWETCDLSLLEKMDASATAETQTPQTVETTQPK